MGTRSAVAAEITRLRERVDLWRGSRRGPGPMPAELWDAAVEVAQERGLYATARGVGIDYGGLAKRMKAEAHGVDVGRSAGVAFVEWSGAEILGQVAGPASTVVEMSDASGRKVTVRMERGNTVDVAGMVAAFCGASR